MQAGVKRELAGRKVIVDLQCSWAVTGSNRRPLRCKGGSEEFLHLRKRLFAQFRGTFRVVSFRLS